MMSQSNFSWKKLAVVCMLCLAIAGAIGFLIEIIVH